LPQFVDIHKADSARITLPDVLFTALTDYEAQEGSGIPGDFVLDFFKVIEKQQSFPATF
jgi:TPP-dependent 2-oxoacid decarboxylase